jgi:hypothetical protein
MKSAEMIAAITGFDALTNGHSATLIGSGSSADIDYGSGRHRAFTHIG